MSIIDNQIEQISLFGNKFRGSIPEWIGSLTKLVYLYLGYNEFSGELPIEICDLVSLKDLWLDNNQIDGMILF
jgi:Leucine-rich repeat (LRR) protein